MEMRHYRKKWYENLIAISIHESPLSTWRKARKYFKKPKINFKISFNKHSYPYACSNWEGGILDIKVSDLMWKDKWDSPRHEFNPIIYISLFRRFKIWITFSMHYFDEFGEKRDMSMEYWEYMLDHLYYSKTHKLTCYPTWTYASKLYKTIKYGNAEDGSEDIIKPIMQIVPVAQYSLNKNGILKLKDELRELEKRTKEKPQGE